MGTGCVSGSKYINYQLGIEEDESVWGIHRLRLGDGQPFAIEYTYVPLNYFEDISKFDFAKVSLYDYMGAKEHLPVHFTQKLIVCRAGDNVSEWLKVKRGSAIFLIEYQGADAEYNIVEYTKSYLNPVFAGFRYNAKNE